MAEDQRQAGAPVVAKSSWLPPPEDEGGQEITMSREGSPRDKLVQSGPSDVENGGEEGQQQPQSRWRRIMTKIDAFAAKTAPARFNGGVISVALWLGTIGYVAYLIHHWFYSPLIVAAKTDWSLGNGPFPMDITCQAMSGCYVSNRMDPAGTARVVPNEAQQGCMFLDYQESMTLDFMGTILTNDGPAILFDPATSSDQLPSGGFGYTINSQVPCDWNPDIPCDMGMKIRPIPIGQGLNLISYVLTNNHTAEEKGKLRHEFFGLPVDMKSSEVSSLNTPCADQDLPAGLVQSRLMIMPSFTIYYIRKDFPWASMMGEVGGAYELLFLVGALVLAGMSGEGCILMNILAAFGGIGSSS